MRATTPKRALPARLRRCQAATPSTSIDPVKAAAAIVWPKARISVELVRICAIDVISARCVTGFSL